MLETPTNPTFTHTSITGTQHFTSVKIDVKGAGLRSLDMLEGCVHNVGEYRLVLATHDKITRLIPLILHTG